MTWGYQTTSPASQETYTQVKKQQFELDMEQTTVQNLERNMLSCILSPYLFNLYADYILWNAGLDED